jgi:hypothetical protein
LNFSYDKLRAPMSELALYISGKLPLTKQQENHYRQQRGAMGGGCGIPSS